jgi:hypothetical protein
MYAISGGQIISRTAEIREIGAFVAHKYVQVTVMSDAGQPIVTRLYDSTTTINPFDWAFQLCQDARRG